ncbi:MAG: transcription antitermination factor NusB, partial [Proteobacteria bacterium]|nr:transcription antitermination factor NusB [Pseudomonadota bacterium]
MTTRREARNLTLQALFQIDVGKHPPETAIENVFADTSDADARAFVTDVVRGACANLDIIDRVIASRAANWKVDRLNRVDRTVLRIAIYEMLYRDDIPAPVSINEAVDLAREYGGEESGRFVNGVLGSLVPQAGGTIDREKVMKEAENIEITTVTAPPEAETQGAERRLGDALAQAEAEGEAPPKATKRASTRKKKATDAEPEAAASASEENAPEQEAEAPAVKRPRRVLKRDLEKLAEATREAEAAREA